MVKPLSFLVLSVTSENVLKIHSRAKTQMLHKRLITARTFHQHEIYLPETVYDDRNPLRASTFYTMYKLTEVHESIYPDIWKSMQAT